MVMLGMLAVLGYLFYVLFIKGVAWPILTFLICVYAGPLLITRWIPSSSATIMTFMGYSVSYAAFISGLVCILGIGYFMKDEQ